MIKKILVLGSSNVDFVLRVPRFHIPGETLTAQALVTVFGGKGANQAIAAKKLGGKVHFITKLGSDDYGQSYRRHLVKCGLEPKGLLKDRKSPTGMAFIELTPEGENRIIVFPGANGSLSERETGKLLPLWRKTGVFVTQMEIPMACVRMGLQTARDHGAITLLNPSPPLPLPPEGTSVDFLVPNEVEAEILTGIKIRRKGDIRKAARSLLGRGVKNVVITLGPGGLFFANETDEIWMEAFRVDAIDTTAAGDAFLGGLAVGLSEGKSIRDALTFASGAGALATTKLGAQPSLPSRKALEAFLRTRT